jgi:glycosyltransferase involved in cell wall biosynthesis
MRVLVLDANSDDRTVEFARAAGAEVIEREWAGFIDARTFAVSQVRTPWTLMIDADEALDDELRDAVIAASGDVNAYVLRRTTYFCGKPLRMWRDEPLVRLFRTGKVRLEARSAAGGGALLHERWLCDEPCSELRGALLHFSYPDITSYREKLERYTDEEARGMPRSWLRTFVEWALLWPRFARLLFFKGALLDGPRGVAAAYGSARYRYFSARKALRRVA